jgi:hypothetical protein
MLSIQLPSRAARRGVLAAWRVAVLAPVVGLVAFACAEPPTAPRDAAATRPSRSRSPDSVSAANGHTTDYHWFSGWGPKEMGSTSGRACFLTSVAGMFGSSRYVRIYSANGSWWLTGSPSGVSAVARCSNSYTSGVPTEYSWSQGQNPTYMGSIYGRACFLTRVGGDFESANERVEVFTSNGAWYLGGSSVQAGVHARARCIVYPWFFPKQPYSYSNWHHSNQPSGILQPTTWACYLAGMRGDFEGSLSSVHVFQSGGSWYIKASRQSSLTGHTYAKAGCTSK